MTVSFLAGCACTLPVEAKPIPAPSPGRQSSLHEVWLPIRERQHHVIAVGGYQLPGAIVIPAGLKPIPSALAFISDVAPHDLRAVQVFFPAGQERAARNRARSFPAVVFGAGGFRWYNNGVVTSKHDAVFVRDPASVTGYSLSSITGYGPSAHKYSPSAPPSADDARLGVPFLWKVLGVADTQEWTYSVVWQGAPGLASVDVTKYPTDQRVLESLYGADYAKHDADYFGFQSPVRNEPRLVSVRIMFFRHHAPSGVAGSSTG